MLSVLRLGHRLKRDFRVTTHCGLVARAFGAERIYIAGDYDEKLITRLKNIVERFGGPFYVDYVKNWTPLIQTHKENQGIVVHLTMYGQKLLPVLEILRPHLWQDSILIVVGAGKVPGEIFSLADYNVAVTNQPHSEISSLAVFLDRLQGGKELDKAFKNAQIKIVPNARGKCLERSIGPHDSKVGL
ncbi:MAG: tRNA (cytidine(56)-2'-O)-methyltransferase [Candidatus Heimdallarchaeota archaeon]